MLHLPTGSRKTPKLKSTKSWACSLFYKIHSQLKMLSMKKLTMFIFAISLVMSSVVSSRLNAEVTMNIAPVVPQPIEPKEASVLLARLNEINTMDKSNLSSFEKKQLRKETRSIKQSLKAVGGGVYLSVGAIIIIVLLLILLL